jgi:carbamoyltransferase
VVKRLNEDLRREAALLCVQALHHDNHAYYSYGVSPFFKGAADRKVTMISCIDGGGDASATSLYKATGEQIELIKRGSRENSLGVFYMLCSSFLGGWAPLSSEGRYMGAAAWGNGDRLTNPVYKRLRQFFYFGPQGEVFVNSAMTHDECRELQNIVGPFLPVDGLWNPDAVLNVDDITHAKVTQERVDKAAAVQMVFEDALFHIIAHLIEETRSDQLVLCGGTALNCVSTLIGPTINATWGKTLSFIYGCRRFLRIKASWSAHRFSSP